MKFERRFTSFDGTRIAYRLWGDAEQALPLMFCSGIACDDTYWEKIAPPLSLRRRVVTWDYPYHGDSGPAGDSDRIEVPDLAAHATSLADHLRIERFAIGGHSMGVQVALETYRRAPERVAALVAIAGPYARTAGHLYSTSVGQLVLQGMKAAAGAAPQVIDAFWKLAVDARIADPVGRAAGLIGRAPAEVMRRYFAHLSRLDIQELLKMFAAGQAHSAEDMLPTIGCPVLIIHGTADVMSPITLAREMADRIPSAELVEIRGGAHTLPAEEPDLIVSRISSLLQQLDL